MALPVTIPNQFANATASIPLSQLDTNFTTLANAVNGISSGSETLANVTATVVNATTVDTTNIEVTNIKAKDGTAAGSIADSTGVVTLASSVLTTTDINGGTIDGTAIGGASAAAGSFTTLNTSGQVVFNDAGADVDFRVEGDTDANLLFVDAGNDRVGVKTSSPAVAFDVVGQVRASTGILFGSDTAAANALDDYEEGTWTPTDGSGAGLTFTGASGNCFYTKIGRTVIATFRVTYPSTANGSSAILSGLPFAALGSSQSTQGCFFSQQNFSAGLMGLLSASTSNIFFITTDGSTASARTNADVSGKDFRGAAVYQV